MLDDTKARWPLKPLSEVVDLNPRLDKSAYRDDIEVSFVPMVAVEAGSGRMDVSQTKQFSAVKKGYTPFKESDVLFAKITPCMENGKMAVVPRLTSELGFGSTEFHVLRPHERVDPRFIYYFVSSQNFRREAAHRMTGAVGQKRVPQSFLEEALIPVPLFDDQRRIVAEIEKQFSRLDEAVANLKRYKAAVLKAAVEGKLTEAWRKQHPNVEPADNFLKRTLSERRTKWTGRGQYNQPGEPETSDLPKLPDKWLWARLDAIASLKGGITVDKNRKSPTARTVPYLRVANVQRGYLDLSEIKTIEAPDADIKDLRLIPGDILFNEGGDRDKLGRGWLWEGQLPECIHQNHVFRARLFLAEVSPKLVSWWGNSFGQAYFLREGKQTTNLASLNLTKLSAFPVPLPPASEQQQIVAEVERRLSVIDELEATVEANLIRADRLRQSILSQAFSGRLLSQDSKDIPSAVATFSIAAESPASYGTDSRAGR